MNEDRSTPGPQKIPQECQAIQVLMTLYHDEKLTEEETYRVNEHLLFCTECICLNLAG